MFHHSLRLAALIWAAATGSIVEARIARPVGIEPPAWGRAEIRAVEGGFAIYTVLQAPDIRPAPTTVSVGGSVRIDKSILVLPQAPPGSAVQ